MSARGVNKVILVGNLGKDPETRYFPDGSCVTDATLATSEKWRDKATGHDKEKTEWHRLVFRDRGAYKLGEIAGQYLKKGSKLFVEGKLQTRKWKGQDGQDRYTTEIIVEEMQMLSAPNPDHTRANGGDMQTAGQARGPDPAQAPAGYQPPQPEQYPGLDDPPY